MQHSAILSTFVKLPFVHKIFDLSFFEWPLKTGFTVYMCGSRKLDQRGSNFVKVFFLVDEEGGSKYHYKRAIIRLSVKHHSNGVSLACRWWPNIECWLGNFVIFRGSGQVLPGNPIFLWFFRGGPDPCPPPPPLWTLHSLISVIVVHNLSRTLYMLATSQFLECSLFIQLSRLVLSHTHTKPIRQVL